MLKFPEAEKNEGKKAMESHVHYDITDNCMGKSYLNICQFVKFLHSSTVAVFLVRIRFHVYIYL